MSHIPGKDCMCFIDLLNCFVCESLVDEMCWMFVCVVVPQTASADGVLNSCKETWFPGLSSFVSLCPPSTRSCSFVSPLLDLFSSWCPGCFPFCLPSTGSCFVVISGFVSLCLPSTGCCFVMVSRFVSLCLPSTGSCSNMISKFVSICLPSTGSCFVLISRFVSLCLFSTGSCFVVISRFVSLLLDLVSSWFLGLSPFVSLVLDPVLTWFPGLSPFVSLLLDPVSSWFPGLSPLVSLLLDPVSSWFPGFSPCVSPFYWIWFRPRFGVCHPLHWIQFPHDFEASLHVYLPCRLVSLSLPSTGSSFIMIFQVCLFLLPSTGSCFVMLSRSVIWMLVSLRFPSKFLVQGSILIMVWRRVLLCLPLYIFGRDMAWSQNSQACENVRMWERLFRVDACVIFFPVGLVCIWLHNPRRSSFWVAANWHLHDARVRGDRWAHRRDHWRRGRSRRMIFFGQTMQRGLFPWCSWRLYNSIATHCKGLVLILVESSARFSSLVQDDNSRLLSSVLPDLQLQSSWFRGRMETVFAIFNLQGV